MKKHTCKTCWWWKASNNDNYPKGQCRIKAPVAIADGYEPGSGCPETCWAETLPDDYCGEYKRGAQQ